MGRVAVAAALLAVAGSCAAPSGAAFSPAASTRDCSAVTFPFPAPALALGEADGAAARVHVGDLIGVTLQGDAAHRWEPIRIAGDALVARPDPAAMTTVGTQLGELCAIRTGQATLTSTNDSRWWSVTVEVVR